MRTIQLSDTLFVDIADGDVFLYIYDHTHIAVQTVYNDIIPPINEFTIEIISFYSHRHFLFRRNGAAYWWEEVEY